MREGPAAVPVRKGRGRELPTAPGRVTGRAGRPTRTLRRTVKPRPSPGPALVARPTAGRRPGPGAVRPPGPRVRHGRDAWGDGRGRRRPAHAANGARPCGRGLGPPARAMRGAPSDRHRSGAVPWAGRTARSPRRRLPRVRVPRPAGCQRRRTEGRPGRAPPGRPRAGPPPGAARRPSCGWRPRRHCGTDARAAPCRAAPRPLPLSRRRRPRPPAGRTSPKTLTTGSPRRSAPLPGLGSRVRPDASRWVPGAGTVALDGGAHARRTRRLGRGRWLPKSLESSCPGPYGDRAEAAETV